MLGHTDLAVLLQVTSYPGEGLRLLQSVGSVQKGGGGPATTASIVSSQAACSGYSSHSSSTSSSNI